MAFWDLTTALLLLAFLVIAFANAFYFREWIAHGEATRTYFAVVSDQIMMIFSDFNNDNYDSLQYVFFFMSALAVSLLVFNLAIGLTGNTLDKWNAQKVKLEYQELCSLVLQLESLMFWNRNEEESDKHIVYAEYKPSDTIEDFDGMKVAFDKKFDSLEDQIIKNKK